MYSLVNWIFDGKLKVTNVPVPSLVVDADVFLAGAVIAVGLFILVSRMKSRKYLFFILVTSGLLFSVCAWLVQNFMEVWFPDLFIPGGPYGTWYVFRNDLSGVLEYISILIGSLIPACLLLPDIKITKLWRCLLLLFTLMATTILYYSYLVSVMMTPGSNISIIWLFPATSPFIASIAITFAILGYFYVLSEILTQIESRLFHVILAVIMVITVIFLTYQTAVAVYAVIFLPLLVKFSAAINRIVLVAILAVMGIFCEFIGSYLAAIGPDVGQYFPIWVFPLVFMVLLMLAPLPYFMPKMDDILLNLTVFGVVLGAGVLIAIVEVYISTGIYMQPDLLPQSSLSIVTNAMLGMSVAAILYQISVLKLHKGKLKICNS
ncbi:hypothetical protein L1994_08945 [Methanomicrobium antiquum]|uniref:Uncharacterized protein n=1 Tax=Methanomicrobium antiquum TaxID=487686 RepID=A0AAF0JMB6_9EURY|nr:hypothetical protein [Methanomicrobium antiquum]WFN36266.1 hypothetical protein L1994_08945 [Methanomicrobium antiquum]